MTERGGMTPASIDPMPTKGRPKEIVRLSEQAVEKLAKRAHDEGVPKSAIMRRAIHKELGIEPEGES